MWIEKFENFYVRIDILERLFMQIINFNSKNEREIKMIPAMLNLLGCSKESFQKLIKSMGYNVTVKDNEVFFKYKPQKSKKKGFKKHDKKESPFGVLKNLNFN